MSYGLAKRDNTYARALHHIDAPKTVWMAIAASFAARIIGEGEIATDKINALIIEEWQALYDNGIVPQRVRVSK